MGRARAEHQATVLPSGRVLVTGGFPAPDRTAEIYDPATDAWIDAGMMATARGDHTATLLPNGKVLVAFGFAGVDSAELYDETTDSWTSGGTWRPARSHSATVLFDGRLLVVGGAGFASPLPAGLYNPLSNTWADATAPVFPHSQHVAVQLVDGRVLVTPDQAELFDPDGGTWSSAATPRGASSGGALGGRLPNGHVLLTAGQSPATNLLSTEVFDGTTWVDAGTLAVPHILGAAVFLPSGRVVVVGGHAGTLQSPTGLIERFDPSTNRWRTLGSLAVPRFAHTASLLPSGLILVAGGADSTTGAISSTELIDPTRADACDAGSQCVSGFCVEGLCCDSSCVGGCNTCARAGSEGACVIVDAGAPGDPTCAPFVCNGAIGQCPSSCTADDGCSDGGYCGSNTCSPRKPLGAPCALPNECTSGNCVDGVCCNTACGGGSASDCLACSLDGGICGTAPATHVCRPAVAACDAPESCTGTDPACPINLPIPMGTPCRASTGFCDPAEVCDGFPGACPTDRFAPVTTVCRIAAGTCDLPETCDGTSATCPPDLRVDAGTVCRPVAGACDAEDVCTGANPACPFDRAAPDGTICFKGGRCEGGMCMERIPPAKDAGIPAVDAGLGPAAPSPTGCGCASADGVFALAILFLVPRRRVR